MNPLTHGESSPIPLHEAVTRPEFWIVTGLTTSRLVAGVFACLLSIIPEYSNLGGVLTFYALGMDLLDGNYARKHRVETNFGEILDTRTDIIALAAVLIFAAAKFG